MFNIIVEDCAGGGSDDDGDGDGVGGGGGGVVDGRGGCSWRRKCSKHPEMTFLDTLILCAALWNVLSYICMSGSQAWPACNLPRAADWRYDDPTVNTNTQAGPQAGPQPPGHQVRRREVDVLVLDLTDVSWRPEII